jgi:hypothetical protein
MRASQEVPVMALRWLALAAILSLLSSTPAGSQADDVVRLTNDSGNENGVMVWGSREDSKEFTGSATSFEDISSGTDNQIVAFTKDRAPALDDKVAWTSGPNDFSVDYPPAYEIPIKFWILCASDSCQGIPGNKQGKLAEFLVWANVRLSEERAGFTLVRSDPDWISDQTSAYASAKAFWQRFDEDKCLDEVNHDDLPGHTGGMRLERTINVYIVPAVNDGDKIDERNGWQCASSDDSVVVGRKAIWGTILHEIGHVFSLTHSDDETWSSDVGGDKNLMNSYSTTRRSLTEGQVFRMHFSVDSGLNRALRPELSSNLSQHRSLRDCRVKLPSPPCPPEDTMLWSDK